MSFSPERRTKMNIPRHDENSNKIVAGIDASKDTLEISINSGKTSTIKNAASPIKRFIKRLLTTRPDINMVVFEPTGGYERKLASLLAEAEIPYRRCHPNFAHNFIRSYSVRAKTDALDAKMLALYGLSRDLKPTKPIDPVVKKARRWMTIRMQLVKTITQWTNRKHLLDGEATKDATEEIIQSLKEKRDAAEREALALVKKEAELREKFSLLESIPGFGVLISAYLVLHVPELGRRSGSQICSLLGLAPWARESGKSTGRRHIWGGRSDVRALLYMSAMSAIRFNPDMKVFYERLKENGKPGKAALVAVMRKLAVLANAILKRETPWVPLDELHSLASSEESASSDEQDETEAEAPSEELGSSDASVAAPIKTSAAAPSDEAVGEALPAPGEAPASASSDPQSSDRTQGR